VAVLKMLQTPMAQERAKVDGKRFEVGGAFPPYDWARVGGGSVTPAALPGWRMLVIYRGKHCPLCTRYVAELGSMEDEFREAGLSLWALSADPIERATEHAAEAGWSVPVLAGLTDEQMRQLGLYISSPRSAQETDRNFAEPGLFVINADNRVQIADVSNAPFARPDLKSLWNGIRYVMKNDYPIRGTAG